MGVGAEDSGDAAIEIPAERHLLAGGFGVEIKQNDLRGGLTLDAEEHLVRFAEGIVTGWT